MGSGNSMLFRIILAGFIISMSLNPIVKLIERTYEKGVRDLEILKPANINFEKKAYKVLDFYFKSD